MTLEKVDQVCADYLEFINRKLCSLGAEGVSAKGDIADLKHLRYMCEVVQTFPEARKEKAMRWLGFIQGALWSMGFITIQEAKEANMPDSVGERGGQSNG